MTHTTTGRFAAAVALALLALALLALAACSPRQTPPPTSTRSTVDSEMARIVVQGDIDAAARRQFPCSPKPALDAAARAENAADAANVAALEAHEATMAAIDAARDDKSTDAATRALEIGRNAENVDMAADEAREAAYAARDYAYHAQDRAETCNLRGPSDPRHAELRREDSAALERYAAIANCYADAAERGESGLPECLLLESERPRRTPR